MNAGASPRAKGIVIPSAVDQCCTRHRRTVTQNGWAILESSPPPAYFVKLAFNFSANSSIDLDTVWCIGVQHVKVDSVMPDSIFWCSSADPFELYHPSQYASTGRTWKRIFKIHTIDYGVPRRQENRTPTYHEGRRNPQ